MTERETANEKSTQKNTCEYAGNCGMEVFKRFCRLLPNNCEPENLAANDTRNRIIDECVLLFERYGVRGVTMDQLATRLGMSKKTLYQFFADKQDLVSEVFQSRMSRNCCAVAQITHSYDNAIETMFRILLFINQQLKEINPIALYELQKFHPRAWDVFRTYKEQVVKRNISKNIEKGIAQGYYRADVDVDVIARIMVHDVVLNTDVFPPAHFHIPFVHTQAMLMYLYGISTPEGYALIDQYKKLFLNNYEKDILNKPIDAVRLDEQ